MNKNQLETEETTADTKKGENSDTQPYSSSFQDLYNDLLTTLNNTPVSSTDAEIKEEAKNNKADEEKIDLPPKSANLSELFDIINTHNKKPASSNNADDSNAEKNNEENSVSADNSFKDNILNSAIYDSVVDDLNKQKVELLEKKKEREKESKLNRENESEKTTPPMKEYTGKNEQAEKDDDISQIKEIPEKSKKDVKDEQGQVKIYKPSAKKAEADKSADNINKINMAEPAEDEELQPVSIENDGIEIESELDDEQEDELLKAFGVTYENDADIISGKPKSKKAKATTLKAKPRLKSIYQVSKGEYVSAEQNAAVFEGYKKIYTAEWIKFIASTVCFLILLYMELSPFLNLPLPPLLDPNFYNAVYILINLQILIIVAWLNTNSLFFGIKSIFASVVNIYYISVFFLVLTFIHTIATYFWRFNAPLWILVENNQYPNMMLFNSITVFGLVLVNLYNLLDINIEIMGFKVISSKKQKYAVRLNNKAVLEMDEFRDIIPADTTVGSITKTKFLSNFFSRTSKKKIYGTYEKYFLAVSFSVSALLFAVLLGFKVDKYIALSSAVTVMLTSIPFCSVIVNIFPLYKAQKKAYEMSSAIIGAESVNDHSEVSIVSVYDRDIFPPDQVKIADFKAYGNSRLDMTLQLFCTVFEKLNMVVADQFKVTTTYENSFDKNIDILSIAENGVCFVSNGRKLFMGNSEYISNIGLAVNHNHNFDEQFLKSLGSILFLSSDSEVMAKIYIKYEIVSDFFDIIKSLNKADVCLAIRTFDPNIDNTLLQKFVRMRRFPVKVIKLKDLKEVYRPPENMDSGVVSKTSLKSLIKTLLLCNKTKSVRKSNILIQVIAFMVGIVLTSAVVIVGIINGNIWAINPGYILLFHAFWIAPMLFLSGLTPN